LQRAKLCRAHDAFLRSGPDYREYQIIDAMERNLLGFTEYSASKEKNR
jgi:hypothetical protein